MTGPVPSGVSPMAWDLVIGIIVACVVGSGFCSGCETGLMSVSRARLRHLLRQRHDRRAGLERPYWAPDRTCHPLTLGAGQPCSG